MRRGHTLNGGGGGELGAIQEWSDLIVIMLTLLTISLWMAEQMYNGDLPKSTELMQYAIFNEGQVDGLTTGLEMRNCTVHFL